MVKLENTVELMGYYGNDEIHALSAWTSTSRDLDEEKRKRIDKMLKALALDGHHTPFEKSSLHFLVNVDQATHIHLLKHRIGVSINGESARYKELKEDKLYIPEDWKDIQVDPKHHNNNYIGTQVQANFGDYDWNHALHDYAQLGNMLYHKALEDLTPVLGRKRAKESARFFKAFNSQITMDVMFNWRSFYHFLKLRNSEHAQKEVREIAQKMLQLVKEIPGSPFKLTIEAFGL
jgi:flavin-dependent thymidylate synthase